MWATIKSLFGVSAVTDTAMRIVDKIAGTDWTPQQKADFLINYQNATKHQSVPRRIIAIAVCFYWLLLGIAWLAASIAGRMFYDTAINSGTVLAADISAFMSLNITNPFNLVLGFYFTVNIISGLKK